MCIGALVPKSFACVCSLSQPGGVCKAEWCPIVCVCASKSDGPSSIEADWCSTLTLRNGNKSFKGGLKEQNWSLQGRLEARGRSKDRAKRRYCKQERQGNESSLLMHSSAHSMCIIRTIVLSKELVASLIMQVVWRGNRLYASNPQCGVDSLYCVHM